MPCGDYSQDDEIHELNQRIKAITRVTCNLAKVVKANGLVLECDSESRAWIRKHDKEDAERIQQERREASRSLAAKRAKAKLTSYERGLLGVR